jgi:hypothetical protein
MVGTMAYLNRDEREKLLQELTKMSVSRARGKLRRMDPNVKIAYMRNMQESGEYETRLDMPTCGVVVKLIERETEKQSNATFTGSMVTRAAAEFSLTEVSVEPTPENRT